jgi:malonyl-CoA/methylmalonyl-CoA synthetase
MFTSNPYIGEWRGGTVGLPLPGTEVRIVDDGNALLAHDQVGNIQVRGDNVFVGYWQMPEKTKEEFTENGFFKTGDMGSMSPDGYISIIGRSKDVVITGGLNVYPKEIEELIDAMPGVLESAVIGVPHPDFGEAVTAVVVRKASVGADDTPLVERGVIAELKGQLANFKIPKRVHFVTELPRNAMGKVQKNILRQIYGKI